MHEAWQTHQMNRYYDEQFTGRIYLLRSEIPPHNTILIAEMRIGTELYACQEFDKHEWNEGACYLDRMHANTTLTSREEQVQ